MHVAIMVQPDTQASCSCPEYLAKPLAYCGVLSAPESLNVCVLPTICAAAESVQVLEAVLCCGCRQHTM